MSVNKNFKHEHRARALLLALVLATAAATGNASAQGSWTDRVKNFFLGAPAGPSQSPGGSSEAEEIDCPPLDIRSGTSTLTVFGPGDSAATNVRYQATVGRLARECRVAAGNMVMKIGVQGRIIIGPLGAPPQLDVPLRVAVVQEGPDPKTVWSKLYRVPVAVPAGAPNATFVHIEENLSFPNPNPADLDAYVVYVGFDKEVPKEKPGKRSKPAPKSKPQAEQPRAGSAPRAQQRPAN